MGIPDIPEKELLARCVRGDKQAWDLFVLKYSRLIRHALQQTIGHKNPLVLPEAIDDLHQEVFYSLMADDYRKLRQFKGKNGCSLASWIRMIAVRKAIDHLRRGRPTISIEENPSNCENFIESSNKGLNPEEMLLKLQEVEIVAEIIRKLPPRSQLLIELYYRRELPIEEIAQIMKLDANAVYQLHYRIKEKVREILSNDYPDLAAA